MRISNNQIYDRALTGVIDNQSELVRIQQQLSSGKRILTPSDDPVGAAQVVRLTEELAELDHFKNNNTLLQNSLDLQETALENVTSAVDRARTLVIQANNGANSANERVTISSELQSLRDEIFDLMNTRDADGNYIFAGNQSDSPAFIFDSGATGNRYRFQGDDGQNEIQIANNVTVADGDSGRRVFEDVFARLDSTISGGTATSTVTVVQQDRFDDFHESRYDAIVPANNTFLGTINGAGTQISFTDAGGNVIGTSAFSSGTPFTFNGMEFNVTGTPGQTVQFTLDQPEKKNLAVTLDEVINALKDDSLSASARQEALKDASVGLENGGNRVSDITASLGGRLNTAISTQNSNLDLEVLNKSARSKIQDVDYAEAVSQLSRFENSLQAAQQTFSRVTSLSLFDFLR